jgi:hypothetical protein
MKKWLSFLKNVPAQWRRCRHESRALYVEAFFCLTAARLAIMFLPFKALALLLGQPMKETSTEARPEAMQQAERIGRIVTSAARCAPFPLICLPQAIAGRWMLERRHIATTLYFGVARDAQTVGKPVAHAWLRCCDRILIGEEGHERFTRVIAYS